jgi:hypothetical protein
MTSLLDNAVVLPGTMGPESLPFIMGLLVLVFVAASLHDRWKKRRNR